MEAEFFHVVKQTDGRDEANSLFWQLRKKCLKCGLCKNYARTTLGVEIYFSRREKDGGFGRRT